MLGEINMQDNIKQNSVESLVMYLSFNKLITLQKLFLMLTCFSILLLTLIPVSYAAEADGTWQDITDLVSVKTSSPSRSRRSPDASVKVTVSTDDISALSWAQRLVIGNLTSRANVEISNATGVTESGEPYFDLTIPSTVTVKVTGGRNIFSFTPLVEQQEEVVGTELTVKITSPETLKTVGATPLAIQGTINDPEATLTVNGVTIEHNNGSFSASVALEEGHNTVLARAIATDGTETTGSISVSLDTTPPFITIESPTDGSTVNIASIAVSGLVNDIVRGTVSNSQATVTVNGNTANVSNRSYLAQEIALTEGENTITVLGSDEQGNSSAASITINYEVPETKLIALVSGQNQTGQILSVLSEPLKVKLVDDNGAPVVNANVIYRVIQGDGAVGVGTDDEGQGVLVKTDASGVASTQFKLGARSGQGNHRVRAKAVGFDSEVVFYASANTSPGNKVSINSGNNQRGAPNLALPQPLIVAITDQGANLVQGTQVEFKVTVGGGKFQNGASSIIATTDSDGRASASLTLGEEVGLDVHRVSAMLVGTSLNAGFTASALEQGDPGQTRITGVVLDNQDNPLPNVSVRVDGSNRQAVTNEQGQFKITEVPVGPVHILVDGSTTTVAGEWPTLSYNIVTIAGAENPLSTPVYMVKLNTENAVFVGREDKTLTLDEVPGFKLEVKAGSVTFPDGSREGLLSVTPVNASKVPMAPPNGMQPQFIVTIQPSGARFDPPAPLTLPNVDGHLPGAQVEMYSYDHDLEEFVTIGLGTVSGDGSLISSNIGVGVIKAGWHCGSSPGGQGCANDCAICKDCDGDCNCVPADGDPRLASIDVAGDCKKPECSGGSATQVNDDSDMPSANECKVCKNGTPTQMAITVAGSINILKNQVETYTASSVDGALPSGDLNWTAIGSTINGSNTGTSVSITFSTASISAADLKTVKATCGSGNDSIDVCVVDSGVAASSVSAVNYIESAGTPSGTPWGKLSLSPPFFNVDITAYYELSSNSWKAKLTKVDMPYDIWYRLLPGRMEASAAVATAANCIKMIQDLTALGGSDWYMISAVEAHERQHVIELKASATPELAAMKASIEALSVPHTCGIDVAAAEASIKALPGYATATNLADSNFRTVYVAIPDPNANTNAAERAVVNPVIASIKVRGVANGWPAVCQ